VLSRPYVAGMFCLPFLQEMVSALIDFQQAYLAEVSYAEQGLRTNYFFSVSLWLQIISCSFALLGTSYVHRKIGTTYSLMAYPLLLLGAAGFYWVNPTLQAVTLFIVMLKAFHYAFNQPVRETLYIPTSRDIKYKARAWIDMIGMRGAKMAGARVAGFIGHVPAVVGSVAIGLLGVWVAMARFVGRYNERAVRDGIVVK
jgi:AAA family ATP:ADP antiporter